MSRLDLLKLVYLVQPDPFSHNGNDSQFIGDIYHVLAVVVINEVLEYVFPTCTICLSHSSGYVFRLLPLYFGVFDTKLVTFYTLAVVQWKVVFGLVCVFIGSEIILLP